MTISEEVKQNRKIAHAPIRHQRIELFKTILIAVMVTALLFFLLGMHVANNNNADKQEAVHNALKG
jgi:hypothetical protein